MADAFSIGLSALHAARRGMEVVGQNLANASNPAYSRRDLVNSDIGADPSGIGGGVIVREPRRIVDDLVVRRLNVEISNAGEQRERAELLNDLELVERTLDRDRLGEGLRDFFATAAQLTTEPHDLVRRAEVIAAAQRVADELKANDARLGDLTADARLEAESLVTKVNALASDLASLNQAIIRARDEPETRFELFDRRDETLRQLADLIDVQSSTLDDGTISVRAAGALLVAGTHATSLSLEADGRSFDVTVGASTTLTLGSGRLKALQDFTRFDLTQRDQDLDTIAAALIREVNRVHASGVPLAGPYQTATSTRPPSPEGPFASPTSARLSQAGYAGPLEAGTLTISVTDSSDGTVTTFDVPFDPERDTLGTVATSIAGATGLLTTVSPEGLLTITAPPGFGFDFADRTGGPADPTGFFAATGFHRFFTGSDASNISVDPRLVEDPSLLAAGRAGAVGDGQNAGAIADVAHLALADLDGLDLGGFRARQLGRLGAAVESQNAVAEGAESLRDGMDRRRLETSGVSSDEEVLALVTQEQAFQAAARFLSTVVEFTRVLIGIGA